MPTPPFFTVRDQYWAYHGLEFSIKFCSVLSAVEVTRSEDAVSEASFQSADEARRLVGSFVMAWLEFSGGAMQSEHGTVLLDEQEEDEDELNDFSLALKLGRSSCLWRVHNFVLQKQCFFKTCQHTF